MTFCHFLPYCILSSPAQKFLHPSQPHPAFKFVCFFLKFYLRSCHQGLKIISRVQLLFSSKITHLMTGWTGCKHPAAATWLILNCNTGWWLNLQWKGAFWFSWQFMSLHARGKVCSHALHRCAQEAWSCHFLKMVEFSSCGHASWRVLIRRESWFANWLLSIFCCRQFLLTYSLCGG